MSNISRPMLQFTYFHNVSNQEQKRALVSQYLWISIMPPSTRSRQSSAVKAITTPISTFYTLLSTFPYLPASDIQIPPSTGWSQSRISSLHRLGKSDFATLLLKHLPYILTASRDWRIGYDDTKPINYIEMNDRLDALDGGGIADDEFKWAVGLEPHFQRLDRHVIALTHGS